MKKRGFRSRYFINIPIGILFVAFLFLFISCRKSVSIQYDNPYQLPNATLNGSNIFACRSNDSNWIAKFSIYTVKTSFLTTNNRDTFSVAASGATNNSLNTIIISIFDKVQTGATYDLSDTNKVRVNTLRLFASCGPPAGYGGSQWNRATSGKITITKYSGNYFVPSCCTYGSYEPNSIIAGTFSMIVPIQNCDTIRLTNGRFDINYSQW